MPKGRGHALGFRATSQSTRWARIEGVRGKHRQKPLLWFCGREWVRQGKQLRFGQFESFLWTLGYRGRPLSFV